MGQIDYRALGIKPQLTLDSLIVGEHNRMAAQACREILKAPGETYNPLFLFGVAGCGKSHLMNGVANEMLKTNPDLKVRYISSERFMNEVISGIAEDNVMMVRGRYNSLNLWLLDDVQYLMESKSAQAEFFHIFNNLIEDNQQIILSADRAPNNLLELDKTIRSRLEGGLAIEVKVPDAATRMDILRQKQAKHGLNMDEKMLEYSAGILRSNVRELEGFLKKIYAYVTLAHNELNIELIQRVVREILPQGQADFSPEPIQPAPPPKPTDPNATTQSGEWNQILKSSKIQKSSPSAAPKQEPVPQMQSEPAPQAPPQPQAPPAQTPPAQGPPPQAPAKPLEVVMPTQPPEEKAKKPPPAPPPPPKQEPVAPEKEAIEVPMDSIVAKEDEGKLPSLNTDPLPPKEELVPPVVEEKKPEEILQEMEEEEAEAENDELPSGHKEIKAVFFYPKSCEEALVTVHKKFQDVIKKHKLKFRLKKVKAEGYDYEGQVNYSSFVDICKENKVAVAIVIGPPPSAILPEHDFYDLLSVTLDVQGISLQLINWAEINKDYRYLNLSLDIALVRSK